MKTNSPRPLAARLRPASNLPFNVVLADGAAAKGRRAEQFMQTFMDTLEPGCGFLGEVWTFTKRQMPNRRDPATRPADDATAAHMIFQALREEGCMPDETRAWIEAWLLQRTGAKSALVQLFEPGKSRPTLVVRLSRRPAAERESVSGKKYYAELMCQDDRSGRSAVVSAARTAEEIHMPPRLWTKGTGSARDGRVRRAIHPTGVARRDALFTFHPADGMGGERHNRPSVRAKVPMSCANCSVQAA